MTRILAALFALIVAVPVGPGRTHGTVYVSFDGGRTWPHKKGGSLHWTPGAPTFTDVG